MLIRACGKQGGLSSTCCIVSPLKKTLRFIDVYSAFHFQNQINFNIITENRLCLITLLSEDRLCLALLFIKEYFISVLELH